MGRLSIALFLFLHAAAAMAAAGDHIDMELLPAWNGTFRPDAGTELGVRLISARGGQVLLRITGAGAEIRFSATLVPDVPLLRHFPLHPSSARAVVVEAIRDDAVSLKREIRFHASRERLIGLALPASILDGALAGQPGFNVIPVLPDSLPYMLQGYQAIDTLVSDGQALASLSAAQSRALAGYLGECGRLLLLGVAPSALDALRQIAGCGGNEVMAFEERSQLVVHLKRRNQSIAPPLPTPANLRTLLPDSGQGITLPTLLALFFSLYALLLLLFAHATRGPLLLLIAPLAGSLLLLFAWTRFPVIKQGASWAEMESGDSSARYSLLLHWQDSTVADSISVSRDSSLRDLSTSSPAGTLLMNDRRPAVMELLIPASPLSHREYLASGIVQIALSLSLRQDERGPVVSNHGENPSEPALLSWRGKSYQVPALTGGENWSPAFAKARWHTGSEERLLLATKEWDTAVLLFPFSVAEAVLPQQAVTLNGWLVIRARQRMAL